MFTVNYDELNSAKLEDEVCNAKLGMRTATQYQLWNKDTVLAIQVALSGGQLCNQSK